PCSRPRPSPPPFPTRRSSDLLLAGGDEGIGNRGLGGIDLDGQGAQQQQQRQRGDHAHGQVLDHSENGNEPRLRRGPSIGDQTRRDRKSTRLNSSHSQISYAVF